MSFPLSNLVPKHSTQVSTLLSSSPNYDGRHVRIGILDTGIDPGAHGLESCPNGAPKLVDLQDCTGAGDVNTSQTVPLEKDQETGEYYVRGKTGRRIPLSGLKEKPQADVDTNKVTSSPWRFFFASNEEQEEEAQEEEIVIRVGSKMLFDLLPHALIERLKSERKNEFLRAQNEAEAKANREFAKHVAEFPKLDTRSVILERRELEERVGILKQERSSYSDAGPRLDIVVLRDLEGMWRVLVVSSEDSDEDIAMKRHPLAPFRAEREFATLSESSQMNFAVNVFDDGKLVSIVTDCGAHGTHVAGILAGYFPESPELNGIAPGAQLISFKIGDTRLDSMETGTAVARALSAAAAAGCDLVNMSFGEPSRNPGGGRVQELCRQLVLKHHCLFVASAGNAGPALSTVGAPGGSTPHLLGIGAWVDADMMIAEYAMRKGETPPSNLYTWSSRGPTYDGALGVSICAPGGAVTCVPRWTLASKWLMNGTSMASPSACGGLALVVSALKQLGMPRSPARIRRAVLNTARFLENVEVHAQGSGLLQVASVLEAAMLVPKGKKHFDCAFDVLITSRPAPTTSGYSHGVYLREPWETNAPSEHVVEIRALFEVDEDLPDVGFAVEANARTSKSDHVNMEVRVRLEVTDQSFVRAPTHVLLTGSPLNFKILVDPTQAPMGSVAFSQILGFDEDESRDVGPLFRVPITVIRPELPRPEFVQHIEKEEEDNELSTGVVRYSNLLFSPGVIHRKFLVVPIGATWADVTLRNEKCSSADGRLFALHCLQIRPQSRHREDELDVTAKLESEPGAMLSRVLRVVGGCTLELCLAQYWSTAPSSSGEVTMEVRFGGLKVQPSTISLSPANGWTQVVTIRSETRDTRLEPSGELTKWHTSVAPIKSTISVCNGGASRVAVMAAYPPESRPTWELCLVYEINVEKKQSFKVRLPLGFNELLYDSPVESQMSMVFDEKKKLLGVFDYGSANKSNTLVDPLTSGTCTVITVIRHESTLILERIKDLTLVVERTLSSGGIPLAFHNVPGSAITGNGKLGARFLKRGAELGLVVALAQAPTSEDLFKKLPGNIKPGDVLSGTVSFGKASGSPQVGGLISADVPGGYTVFVVVPPKPTPSASSAANVKLPAPTNPMRGDSMFSNSNVSDVNMKKYKDVEELRSITKSWTIPIIKARLKILDAMDQEDELFDVEMATTMSVISSSFNDGESETRRELELETLTVQLRRSVKAERAQLGKGSDGGDISSRARTVGKIADKIALLLSPLDLDRKPRTDHEGLLQEIPERVMTYKSRLVEALFAKAHALLDALAVGQDPQKDEEEAEDMNKELNACMEAIAQAMASASPKDAKFAQLRFRLAKRSSRWATSLSLLDVFTSGEDDAGLKKLPDPLSTSDVWDERIRLYEELGWTHLARNAKQAREESFPSEYPVF